MLFSAWQAMVQAPQPMQEVRSIDSPHCWPVRGFGSVQSDLSCDGRMSSSSRMKFGRWRYVAMSVSRTSGRAYSGLFMGTSDQWSCVVASMYVFSVTLMDAPEAIQPVSGEVSGRTLKPAPLAM